MDKPHWTKDEIELLRQYFLTSDKAYIEKLFPNRSWGSVLHKANRLKFGKTPLLHHLRPLSIPDLPVEKRIYVAGIADGEGTITVAIRKSPKNILPSMTPMVLFSNSNKALIDYLHPLLLGSTIKTVKETKIRKTVYQIQIAKLLDVEAILTQMLPYLIVKRRQAELVLEYCALRKKDSLLSYNDRLFEIAKEVRRLNEKGPTKK